MCSFIVCYWDMALRIDFNDRLKMLMHSQRHDGLFVDYQCDLLEV